MSDSAAGLNRIERLLKPAWNTAKFVVAALCVVPIFVFAAPLAMLIRLRTRNHSELRILLAGNETSANLREISRSLAEEKSYRVTVTPFFTHPFYSSKWIDENLDIEFSSRFSSNVFNEASSLKRVSGWLCSRLSKTLYIFRALTYYDVIFFNWTTSFMRYNLDYPLYRMAGQRLIVRHCGDDVRYRPLQHGIHKAFGVYQWDRAPRSNAQMWSKFLRQAWAERFAVVLSTRDHATFQIGALGVRPYVQQELPETRGFDATEPLILHAPSDPKIKGTSVVQGAAEILRSNGSIFRLKVLSGVSHDTVLKSLAEAAIVVDQPGAVPARFAVEAMASGCAVVGGNVQAIHALSGTSMIQFEAAPAALAGVLQGLLDELPQAKALGRANRLYVQDNFSIHAFRVFFSSVLEGTHDRFLPLEGHCELLRQAAETPSERLAIRLLARLQRRACRQD